MPWWTRIWHTYFCRWDDGLCPVMLEYEKEKYRNALADRMLRPPT